MIVCYWVSPANSAGTLCFGTTSPPLTKNVPPQDSQTLLVHSTRKRCSSTGLTQIARPQDSHKTFVHSTHTNRLGVHRPRPLSQPHSQRTLRGAQFANHSRFTRGCTTREVRMGNEYSKQKRGQKQGNQAFPPARAEERRQSRRYIHANKLLKS